ncbi:transcription factor Sox-18A-like isoform X2 [Cheilinus undulatus]|uniref:transcription factor Sox-18A-like isoform X2 n=1 Tax=Cheilinus undulatus TaxID=241271 RepID=UPI001BD6DE2C|nr:transcription factor Sox-18A-like isoform X2 [Cheilinus undulatus]
MKTASALHTSTFPAEVEEGKFHKITSLNASPELFELSSPSVNPHTVFQTVLEEEIMELENMYNEELVYNQEQSLTYGLPVVNDPPTSESAAAISELPPAFFPQPYYGDTQWPSASFEQNLQPVGFLNGSHREMGNKPYIKKPPNAFMIFMTEQRQNMPADIKGKGAAVANTFLGQLWKSMTKEQKSVYYDKADAESYVHSILYPEWSTSDNYGKKRKRIRRRNHTRAEGVMEPSTEKTCSFAEPYPQQTAWEVQNPLPPVFYQPHRESTVPELHHQPRVLHEHYTVTTASEQPFFHQPLMSDPLWNLSVNVTNPITSTAHFLEMQPLEKEFMFQANSQRGVVAQQNLQSVCMQSTKIQPLFTAPVCPLCYLPNVFQVDSMF